MRTNLYQFVILFLLALGLPTAVSATEALKLVVLGDSLSAGYQLAPGEGFPSQLQKTLSEKGYAIEVINAGVSGDTSSGGLGRLDWSVGPDVDAVIVELGANDMLRGIAPELTRENLTEIVSRLRERGVEVLVAGMLAQRNLGDEYANAFDPIYADVATAHDALLYPFFLEGVALNPELNLPDGMHPTGEGVSVIVQNMLPKVEELLKRAGSS
ncbi:arylesterase [Labrenzia sp. CE80]|uniref:arylesterase n=1 Tax=Labrenzia sp. CE80 TaxID=1788986 RepID=UPI00129A751A|nr:arylesterase [Labrenzia sp. CE80]